MDKLSDLFTFFLKIAAGIFALVFVVWMANIISGSVKGAPQPTATSTPKVDLLPSPRKYSGFLRNASSTRGVAQAPIFSAASITTFNANNIAFSSTSNNGVNIAFASNPSYVTYTAPTGQTVMQQPAHPTAEQSSRSQYIRNLSIYESGSVYTGLGFVGEARSQFFREGRFPILIVNAQGKVVGMSFGVAESVWSVPGWVRFSTKINYALPVKEPCTMIFEEMLSQSERNRAPFRVAMPIRCN
jgi:hypothetical protein